MDIAKIFENGGSQAVRLPKKYRFESDDVIVSRLGSAVLLIPRDKAYETFLEGLNSFSDDFMSDGRSNEPEMDSERESL